VKIDQHSFFTGHLTLQEKDCLM